MLTDLQNAFTAGKSVKFPTKRVALPPHVKYVAALPRESLIFTSMYFFAY